MRLQVGQEIRRQRESQKLTLHKLADMSGTSYTHLWKVENGKVSVGLDLLGRISNALDVPLRQIVDPQGTLMAAVAMEYHGSVEESAS